MTPKLSQFPHPKKAGVKGTGDKKIAACTSSINSGIWKGPNLAWAYTNRGFAYRAKGDPDRAIADYDKAIWLNPKFTDAHNGRGGAFGDRGDRDRVDPRKDEVIELGMVKFDYLPNGGSRPIIGKGRQNVDRIARPFPGRALRRWSPPRSRAASSPSSTASTAPLPRRLWVLTACPVVRAHPSKTPVLRVYSQPD
jgi:tetratricopeptide (TPR) repeat protein